MNNFYTTSQLGPSQSLTPEGFLIVKDAVLARTGLQIYSDREVPIRGDSDGRVIITRDEEEVFRPETIASLNGKPVTLDHPMMDVTPDNYNKIAVGHVINPRRGAGILDNVLLGDLIITSRDAIGIIRDNLARELSVGYDAEYVEDGVGRGKQKNIIANHVAIVADGRCGPLCRIGDRQIFKDSVIKPKAKKKVHFHIHL
jgi:hypothetical protein